MKRSIPVQRHLGGITVTKVVREHQELTTDPDGQFQTIGQMLDFNLHTRLKEGETIQDIAFHFDTENVESMKTLHAMYGLLDYSVGVEHD
jgi:hypothetical protein